jgi:hypothetical protein
MHIINCEAQRYIHTHTCTLTYSQVVPEVRQIFDLLTAEFSPLELCSRLAPLLTRLEEMTHTMSPASPVKDVVMGQYVDSLKQVRVCVCAPRWSTYLLCATQLPYVHRLRTQTLAHSSPCCSLVNVHV